MARNLITTSFSGSTPRRADHLTPTSASSRALDCKLWHGTLDCWREPRPIRSTSAGTNAVYHAFNCCWLESSTCAHFAEGSVELRHVFATQYNGLGYPVRITLDALCEPTVYRLGLPCPTIKPVVDSAAQAWSKAAAPRQYGYQFVSTFGEASALSPPSAVITIEDGSAAQVSGWTVPPGGWDIQKIRIFRLVAGFESSIKEDANKIDAAWMLVDEIPAMQTSYLDTKSDIDLTEGLREDDVEPPPEDLKGIAWIGSMNCLVGFAGRFLYFSENNNYHNWKFKLQLDDTVKAIVESNDVIYVATDGAPYVVPGAVDCPNAGCRKAIRMPEGLPLVGSGFRSMTALPSGAVYPTHSGLVYMKTSSAPSVVSAQHYAPDDWQALHPDTAKIVYHEGRLFAFFRNGAFCFSLKDGAGTGTELDHHTELSLKPNELLVSRSGRLFLRTGTAVAEWDRGAALMPHTYESGETLVGVPMNFGAAQIIMEPGEEKVQLFCDDFEALNESVFVSDQFPLPLWATGQAFRWVLHGTATVKMFGIAPSTKEL